MFWLVNGAVESNSLSFARLRQELAHPGGPPKIIQEAKCTHLYHLKELPCTPARAFVQAREGGGGGSRSLRSAEGWRFLVVKKAVKSLEGRWRSSFGGFDHGIFASADRIMRELSPK